LKYTDSKVTATADPAPLGIADKTTLRPEIETTFVPAVMSALMTSSPFTIPAMLATAIVVLLVERVAVVDAKAGMTLVMLLAVP
jgi:hypothetical protein